MAGFVFWNFLLYVFLIIQRLFCRSRVVLSSWLGKSHMRTPGPAWCRRQTTTLLIKILCITSGDARGAYSFCSVVVFAGFLRLRYTASRQSSPRDKARPPWAMPPRNRRPIPERFGDEEEQQTATKCHKNSNNPGVVVSKPVKPSVACGYSPNDLPKHPAP